MLEVVGDLAPGQDGVRRPPVWEGARSQVSMVGGLVEHERDRDVRRGPALATRASGRPRTSTSAACRRTVPEEPHHLARHARGPLGRREVRVVAGERIVEHVAHGYGRRDVAPDVGPLGGYSPQTQHQPPARPPGRGRPARRTPQVQSRPQPFRCAGGDRPDPWRGPSARLHEALPCVMARTRSRHRPTSAGIGRSSDGSRSCAKVDRRTTGEAALGGLDLPCHTADARWT
jgi:hypothetical protein